MVQLSSSAIKEIRRLAIEMAKEGQGLRFFAQGSCCGKSYGMAFDDVREQDQIMDFEGVKVLVGPESLADIQGLNIDFFEGPDGGSFELMSEHSMGGGCCRSDNESENEGGCCRSEDDEGHGGGCCSR